MLNRKGKVPPIINHLTGSARRSISGWDWGDARKNCGQPAKSLSLADAEMVLQVDWGARNGDR
jgi:hypothetical protein